jgi:aconitate hydratase
MDTTRSRRGATYDKEIEIDLATIEPLIALPEAPVVVTVRVSGLTVNQVVLGSSANPGLRDFWIVSEIIKETRFP